MPAVFRFRASTYLSFALAVVTLVAGLGGLLGNQTYIRETGNWMVQAKGQDWIDLLVGIPLLVVSAFFAAGGNRLAASLNGGIVMFFTYTFTLYAFAVHFNSFFFFYCAGLGLSVHALIAWWKDYGWEAPDWFQPKAPVRLPAAFLIANGVLFFAAWLSEDLPAVWKGQPPASLVAGGFFTNPVHVLDLSLLLPGFLMAGTALWRRRPFGYAWAPAFLCFSMIMATNVAFLAWYMAVKRVAPATPMPYIFGALALVTGWVLSRLLKGLKKKGRSGAGAIHE